MPNNHVVWYKSCFLKVQIRSNLTVLVHASGIHETMNIKSTIQLMT